MTEAFEVLALTIGGLVVFLIAFYGGVAWESHRCDERQAQREADEISRRGFEL